MTDLVAKGYAPATVRQAHRVFSLVLMLAVRHGRLNLNAAQGVRLPRIVQQEKTLLTHEQVSQLAEACRPYELFVTFLAYTGLLWVSSRRCGPSTWICFGDASRWPSPRRRSRA